MPTNRTRQVRTRTGRQVLTPSKIQQHICGWDFFSDAYGEDPEVCDRLMEPAWEVNRSEIEAAAQSDPVQRHRPIYSHLRFDRRMSRESALRARSATFSHGREYGTREN